MCLSHRYSHSTSLQQVKHSFLSALNSFNIGVCPCEPWCRWRSRETAQWSLPSPSTCFSWAPEIKPRFPSLHNKGLHHGLCYIFKLISRVFLLILGILYGFQTCTSPGTNYPYICASHKTETVVIPRGHLICDSRKKRKATKEYERHFFLNLKWRVAFRRKWW